MVLTFGKTMSGLHGKNRAMGLFLNEDAVNIATTFPISEGPLKIAKLYNLHSTSEVSQF
jgi:hypothetical protein